MPSAARPKPIGSTEMIADALRGAICSGEIAPGAPLKQDEIAAEFGVSHTPVREVMVDLPYKIGIDTGLVYGGKLRCLELTEGTLHQIGRGSRQVRSRRFEI